MAACVVLSASGAAPSRELLSERRQVRIGFALAVVVVVVISIPLVTTGIGRAREWTRATAGAPIVREWIGERELRVREWSVEDDEVILALEGSDSPGDTQQLASALATAFGAPVTLTVTYVPTTDSTTQAAP